MGSSFILTRPKLAAPNQTVIRGVAQALGKTHSQFQPWLELSRPFFLLHHPAQAAAWGQMAYSIQIGVWCGGVDDEGSRVPESLDP